jgi:hypothetical protein
MKKVSKQKENELTIKVNKSGRGGGGRNRRKEEMKKEGATGIKEARSKQLTAIE